MQGWLAFENQCNSPHEQMKRKKTIIISRQRKKHFTKSYTHFSSKNLAKKLGIKVAQT